MADQPRFYFAVAQQPDILNTAFLDGDRVVRSFVFRSLNSSAVTREIDSGLSNLINKPENFTCSASGDSVVILSGEWNENYMLLAHTISHVSVHALA